MKNAVIVALLLASDLVWANQALDVWSKGLLSKDSLRVESEAKMWVQQPQRTLEEVQEFTQTFVRQPALYQAGMLSLGRIREQQGAWDLARSAYGVAASGSGDPSNLAMRALTALDRQHPIDLRPRLVIASGSTSNSLEDERRKGLSLALSQGWIDTASMPLMEVNMGRNLQETFWALEEVSKAVPMGALITPMASEQAAMAIAWAQLKSPGLPVVSATATEQGLSQMNPHAYQLNVSPQRWIELMVEDMRCRSLKRIAVLAPQSEFGKGQAERFAAFATKQGLHVTHLPTYAAKTINFTKLIPSWKISGSKPPYDALFHPATNAEEASALALQLMAARTKIQIYGSGGWASAQSLSLADRAADGVRILGLPTSTRKVLAFNESYTAQFGRSPSGDRVAALTADALVLANFLAKRKSTGDTSSWSGSWDGYAGPVWLGADGGVVNLSMTLFSNGLQKSLPQCK